MCVAGAKVTAATSSAAVSVSAAITEAATSAAAATARCNGLSLQSTTTSGGGRIKVGCAHMARGYVDLVTVTCHMKSA